MSSGIMEQARRKAILGPDKRFRHYAILTDKRGKIVSEGSNDYTKTHPLFKVTAEKLGVVGKSYIHAEFQAVLRDRYKQGYKLTVVRVGANGELMPSMPCPICMHIIKQYKHIKAIEWS